MNRAQIIKLLFSPSFLSGLVCVIVAAVILAAGGWSYIATNFLFYDYFFGTQGIVTALVVAPDSISAWQLTFFRSQTTYFIVIVIVAIIGGLLVYVSLQGLGRVARELAVMMGAIKTKAAASREVLAEALMHAAVRVLSVMAWIIYGIFFSTTVVPFCVLYVQIGIEDITNDRLNSGLVSFATSFVLMVVALHVNVIFARLSLLRIRIFGGEQITE